MRPNDSEWQALVDALVLPGAILDTDRKVIACNDSYGSFCGRRAEQIVGLGFDAIFRDNDRLLGGLKASFDGVAQSGRVCQIPSFKSNAELVNGYWTVVNLPVLSKAGHRGHILHQLLHPASMDLGSHDSDQASSYGPFSPFDGGFGGGPLCEAGLEHEISNVAERERINFLFKQAPSFICILKGPNHVYEFANDAYYQLVGHREIVGHELAVVLPEVVPQGFLGKLNRVYETGIPFIGRALPIELQRESGAPLEQAFIDLMYQPIRDEHGHITGIFVQGHDVTEAHRLSQLVAHQATHDPLTGLANRRLLEDLSSTFELADSPCVIVYLDLDHFKVINDRCGHVAGDRLLVQVADTFRENTGPEDFLARIGGDEFVMVLKCVTFPEAIARAHRLRDAIRAMAFVWDGRKYGVTLSAGLALLGGPSGFRFAEALSLADSACFLAKEKGRNRIQIGEVDDEEICRQKRDMDWATRIKEAIEDDRILLWVQQIVPTAEAVDRTEAKDDEGALKIMTRSRCYEVLARLQGLDGDIVLPGAFIPAAERFGLVEELDGHIVRKLFDVIESNASRLSDAVFFVNLSGVTLSREDFKWIVFDAMKRYPGVVPEQICFEVTETSAITHLTRASEAMRSLMDAGFSFALDDFGSGMSSFGYLGKLPVTYVKIDGEFIRAIDEEVAGAAIVEAVGKVAKAMNVVTIAEHVEKLELVPRLKGLGVDMVQGYALHIPESIDSLIVDQ